MATAAGLGRLGRAPACLCVLCGLPAAGKSTLAARILRNAAEHGWRATVVTYDDLVPELAFRTRGVEDGGRAQDMVNLKLTQSWSWNSSFELIGGGLSHLYQTCLNTPSHNAFIKKTNMFQTFRIH